MIALVLEGVPAQGKERAGAQQAFGWPKGWRDWLLGGLLCGQVYAGCFALGMSLRYPFSHSREVADLLRRQHLEGAPLVFEPDYVGSAVLAYLGRPDDYDLEQRRRSSFIIWDRREFLNRHVPSSEELHEATGGVGSPVLITEVPLTDWQEQSLQVHRIGAFTAAICDLDTYFVYR